MIGKRVKLSSLHHHYHEVNTVDTEELKQLQQRIRCSRQTFFNNKEEVEALKLVTTKTYYDLLNDAKTSNHFIASNKKYYEFVLKKILEKLNN